MNAMRLQLITEAAARVLAKPAMAVTTCSFCKLPSGEVPHDPAFAGRQIDKWHDACVAALRATARPVAA